MKRFSIPPREERERHSHTMSAYSFMPNQVTDDSILFIFQFICREYMTPKK